MDLHIQLVNTSVDHSIATYLPLRPHDEMNPHRICPAVDVGTRWSGFRIGVTVERSGNLPSVALSVTYRSEVLLRIDCEESGGLVGVGAAIHHPHRSRGVEGEQSASLVWCTEAGVLTNGCHDLWIENDDAEKHSGRGEIVAADDKSNSVIAVETGIEPALIVGHHEGPNAARVEHCPAHLGIAPRRVREDGLQLHDTALRKARTAPVSMIAPSNKITSSACITSDQIHPSLTRERIASTK